MSQISQSSSTGQGTSSNENVAPELTLAETLRVLEVARGMRQDRAAAEVALARNEIRELLRKRLMDAAAITGDQLTESDVDAAIRQYFQTQHAYSDPPFSFSTFLAHLYVRRLPIALLLSAIAALVVLIS